jgi:hypothetical protein
MEISTIAIARRNPAAVPHAKRSLSPHQRQMRFFTVMFVALTLASFGALMCLINR